MSGRRVCPRIPSKAWRFPSRKAHHPWPTRRRPPVHPAWAATVRARNCPRRYRNNPSLPQLSCLRSSFPLPPRLTISGLSANKKGRSSFYGYAPRFRIKNAGYTVETAHPARSHATGRGALAPPPVGIDGLHGTSAELGYSHLRTLPLGRECIRFLWAMQGGWGQEIERVRAKGKKT